MPTTPAERKILDDADRIRAEAASTAAQAGTDTGQTQAGAGAAHRSAGAETTSDIGQAEAYIVNLKRLIANETNFDAVLSAHVDRRLRNAEDYDQTLRNLTVQRLESNNALSDRIKQNSATHDGEQFSNRSHHHDLAVEHHWSDRSAVDREVERTSAVVSGVLVKLGLVKQP